MSNNDPIDLRLVVHHQSQMSWLVSDDGNRDKAVWLPKSQCTMDETVVGLEGIDEIHDFEVPTWLAEKKGLI